MDLFTYVQWNIRGEVALPFSKFIIETVLRIKRRTPRLYEFIRDSSPGRLRSAINKQLTDSLGVQDDAKEIFTTIFQRNWWNNKESKSGWGSELKRTELIRRELLSFVERHSVRSILDAPCGDFHWMRYLQWPTGFKYIGGDIVHDLIVDNKRKYPSVEFLELNILEDALPDVDAWLARDFMIHFSDNGIWTAIKQFQKSTIDYLLATTYPNNMQNKDIKIGQVRHLNLCAPPFNLSPPFEVLREDDDPITGRVIGVWRRTDIALIRSTRGTSQEIPLCDGP